MSLTHALIWPLPLWSRCGWLRALHPSVAGSWPRLPACGDGSLGRPPDVLATHLHQGEAVSHPSTVLALHSLLSEITIGSLRLQTLWGAGWFLPFPPPFTLTKNVSKTKGKHTHTHKNTRESFPPNSCFLRVVPYSSLVSRRLSQKAGASNSLWSQIFKILVCSGDLMCVCWVTEGIKVVLRNPSGNQACGDKGAFCLARNECNLCLCLRA